MSWWRRLLQYARSQRRGIAVIATITVFEVVLGTLSPWPLKLIVDNALGGVPLPAAAAWLGDLPGGGSRIGLLVWLAGATLLLFVAAQAAALGKTVLQAGVCGKMNAGLAADLLDHVQRLAPPVFATHKVGDLTARIVNDSRCVSALLMSVLFPAASSLLMLVAMFAVMFGMDAMLSCAALLFALPMVLLIRLYARPMMARSMEQADMEGRLMTSAEQVLTALPEVQAFTAEAREDARFGQQSRLTIRSRLRTLAVQLQFTTAIGVLTALGTAAILLLGGWHLVEGRLSVGGLLVFLAYLTALYAPLETVAYLASGRAHAAAGARRVLEVLDTDPGVPEPAQPRALPALPLGRRGHVRIERAVFGYESGRPILDGVTLEAKPGETVALVGRTGAGKTTLLSLVPRLFDPWSGRVTFDGVDVRDLRREELRRHVAVVSQQPILLPLSVAENIAYGRPAASRAEIEAAAVAANADAFIRRLSAGYDTVLGERGATLSGGERQRIAIARALLKDAPVLILDEPTSALDAETEAELVGALRRLMRQRTSLVIAHRLSTIQHADRIVVLDAGRIVEVGSHAELVAAGGLYQHFATLQFGAAVAGA